MPFSEPHRDLHGEPTYACHTLAWCYPAADGPVQAHLMAFAKPQEKQDQQEMSFPCSCTADLQEEAQELAVSNSSSSSSSSRQVSSGAMLAPGRHYSRESQQELVHTQCWGRDLAGRLLLC